MNLIFEFLNRHSSLIITTHENADADGIGAEIVFSRIANNMGKQVRIINSGPVPEKYRFMDPANTIENWENTSPPQGAALLIVDTSDEYNIGNLREYILFAEEVFVVDHHEPKKFSTLNGYIDSNASSTCEMMVEIAIATGTQLSPETASAAYAGIVYDTGFFAYPKTTSRTFRAALTLVEAGVNPYSIFRELNESCSAGSLVLQKKVLSTLEIYNQGQVAVQILRKEDLESSGAFIEDAENFINVPLKCKGVEVSILIKENKDGQTRCSLRSKGKVNVSKIAQSLGGGGHVTAAGFKSKFSPEDTLGIIYKKVNEELENT